jgi:hypothetical protein
MPKQVDPSKFTEIIYETYIIFILANSHKPDPIHQKK